jgi:hypothetical protein
MCENILKIDSRWKPIQGKPGIGVHHKILTEVQKCPTEGGIGPSRRLKISPDEEPRDCKIAALDQRPPEADQAVV